MGIFLVKDGEKEYHFKKNKSKYTHPSFPPSLPPSLSPSPASVPSYLDDKMAKRRADSRHFHIERTQIIDEKHSGQDRGLVVVGVAIPF